MMVNTVQVFDFGIGANGAAVIAKRIHLTAGCLTHAEIDRNIRLLKEDLDAVAARMKTALGQEVGRAAIEKSTPKKPRTSH